MERDLLIMQLLQLLIFTVSQFHQMLHLVVQRTGQIQVQQWRRILIVDILVLWDLKQIQILRILIQ